LDARAAYTVGASTKSFWVEDKLGKWVEIGTTLRSTGTNSNVWVADANFSNTSLPKNDNKITTAQAAVLATKFDEIYRYETPLFGYEYGGGVAATAPTYGGVDGDPKIQILVYDIDYDYTTAQTGGTLGYFWSKDLYDQKSLDGYGVKTNQAEMFYIDAHFMDAYPTVAHSVLAHEFQHMINFNVKSIRWSTNTNTVIADVWYNEMLSMLAEDVIGPLIGIAPDSEDHVIADRMGSFLAGYLYSGVTDWLSGNDALYSYSSVYAFGAYLARNFGGAKLIKAMMENDTTNEASITAALTALNPGVTFKSALSRYGEALVYSGAPQPDGVLSFDKTATTKINATDYTFTAFNIWTMPNNGYGQSVTIGTPPDTDTYSYPEKGPMVWTLDYLFWMPGNSVILQSTDEWQHVTGALKITAKKPTNANIELYLMVR
ncbi:MAG: hypothetical protein LBS86_07285, partial [Treponema sp.]|nr:hypothetical protein [Treponema sp.]